MILFGISALLAERPVTSGRSTHSLEADRHSDFSKHSSSVDRRHPKRSLAVDRCLTSSTGSLAADSHHPPTRSSAVDTRLPTRSLALERELKWIR